MSIVLLDHLRIAIAGAVWRLRNTERVNQMAALCHRRAGEDYEVLLVTSSEGRWILPKGWPIKGKNGAETAAQEAWEEAGVKPVDVDSDPVGWFASSKTKSDGTEIPCETQVYAVEVASLAKTFPEMKKRKRRWVSIAKALALVDEPGLRRVLKQVQDKQA